MATLITSMSDVMYALDCLEEEQTTGDYLSLLNTSKMQFDNAEVLTGATLLILESQTTGKCYTLAYDATDMDEDTRRELEMELQNYLFGPKYLELGRGSVDASGISLILTTDATDKLHFEDQNIVQITDSSGDDVIYINTQGVATNAELNFFQDGADTIKFNGATTVQKISGGGVAYSRA